jgi:fumarate hydratase, class II
MMNQSRFGPESETAQDHSLYRIEEDALGDVRVRAEHLWGAQTERSRTNFPNGVDRFRWGRPVIRALGILKKCAAAEGEGGPDRVRRAGRHRQSAGRRVPGGGVPDRLGHADQHECQRGDFKPHDPAFRRVLGSKTPVHPNDDVNHGP